MFKLAVSLLLGNVACQGIFEDFNDNGSFGYVDDFNNIGGILDPSPLFTIDDDKNFG